MNKVYYISDFFLNDLVGGGELNDHELCSMLRNQSYEVSKIRSHQLKLDMLDRQSVYIISNFINLKNRVKDYITNNCKYIIYEHDHKYLRSRNPALYNNYTAPVEDLINQEFYKNAKKVICQTSFHQTIIKNNLKDCNLENVSGNLWSIENLNFIRELSKKEKKDYYSIIDSNIPHKNTSETIFYCKQKKYNYELIVSKNYHEFLSLMSNNSKLIFLPKTPETCSRVIVEAKMMNIKVVTNKKVGASYEPWFSLKGEELIDLMLNKRTEILNKIKDVL